MNKKIFLILFALNGFICHRLQRRHYWKRLNTNDGTETNDDNTGNGGSGTGNGSGGGTGFDKKYAGAWTVTEKNTNAPWTEVINGDGSLTVKSFAGDYTYTADKITKNSDGTFTLKESLGDYTATHVYTFDSGGTSGTVVTTTSTGSTFNLTLTKSN